MNTVTHLSIRLRDVRDAAPDHMASLTRKLTEASRGKKWVSYKQLNEANLTQEERETYKQIAHDRWDKANKSSDDGFAVGAAGTFAAEVFGALLAVAGSFEAAAPIMAAAPGLTYVAKRLPLRAVRFEDIPEAAQSNALPAPIDPVINAPEMVDLTLISGLLPRMEQAVSGANQSTPEDARLAEVASLLRDVARDRQSTLHRDERRSLIAEGEGLLEALNPGA